MSEVRTQHYHFAHRVLPAAIHQDPERFVETVRADGMRFIGWLWAAAAQEVGLESLEPTGLDVAIDDLDSPPRTAVSVWLPEPQAMTEAHVVSAVVTQHQPGAAVFTLETSDDVFTGETITVVGAWTPDGTHRNHGTGPAAERSAWLATLTELTAGGRA